MYFFLFNNHISDEFIHAYGVLLHHLVSVYQHFQVSLYIMRSSRMVWSTLFLILLVPVHERFYHGGTPVCQFLPICSFYSNICYVFVSSRKPPCKTEMIIDFRISLYSCLFHWLGVCLAIQTMTNFVYWRFLDYSHKYDLLESNLCNFGQLIWNCEACVCWNPWYQVILSNICRCSLNPVDTHTNIS